jgi:hypothetical protein
VAYALEHLDGTPVFSSASVLVSGPLPERGHLVRMEADDGEVVTFRVVRVEHRIGSALSGPVAHPVAVVEASR